MPISLNHYPQRQKNDFWFHAYRRQLTDRREQLAGRTAAIPKPLVNMRCCRYAIPPVGPAVGKGKPISTMSLVNCVLLLTAVAGVDGLAREGSQALATSLSPPFPATAHGMASPQEVVETDCDGIGHGAWPGVTSRRKRMQTCACDTEKRVKKEKRIKARAREKARARARAEARAAARTAARQTVMSEIAGGHTHRAASAMGGVVGTAAGAVGTGIKLLGGALAVAGTGAVVAGIATGAAGRPAQELTKPYNAKNNARREQPMIPIVTPASKSGAAGTALGQDTGERAAADIVTLSPEALPGPHLGGVVYETGIEAIPRLSQFIHPMNYYRWLFGHEKADQLEAMKQHIAANYRTSDIYLHRLVDSDATIPERFQFLKNNIIDFRGEIEKAQSLVNLALYKFQRTTLRNDYGYLQYAPKNSIKVYLRGALGTDDENILHQAMLRLEYYLLQLKRYFDEYKSNIIFATAKQPGYDSINSQQPLLGFVMPMDNANRVVLMVDYFEDGIILNNRLHITMLHEASHIQAGSRDFVYSPITRFVGDASEILEVFNEALYAYGNEAIACDELFIQSYEHFLNVQVSVAQFLQKVKEDPMLQRNIMMDNADSIAQYIHDIALSRAYNQDYIGRSGRSERDTERLVGQLFIKAIVNLLMKQRGVA
ncbi:hypothetical protein [Martelella alba]|uniref:Uncharacterized protein n=1 Tax=Martelella alba TaxID=2590451 RepID=A0ABY2SLL0_9HYPH|nr:hypothetical protein [Martelella alba]TKI06079.1 hypothetical protein FCN80_11185 [Martelella alba]